jgi:hypothetical protein
MGKRGVGYRVLVGAYDGKRTFGTSSRDGIFKKLELGHGLVDLPKDRGSQGVLVKTLGTLQVP